MRFTQELIRNINPFQKFLLVQFRPARIHAVPQP